MSRTLCAERQQTERFPAGQKNHAMPRIVLTIALSSGLCSAAFGQTNAPLKQVLTFNKDVAPIIFEHCAGCHRPSQPGPFNLLTYQDVKKHAKQVADVVGRRYMPPWLPEKGYGEFADDRSLAAEQIEILRRWVAEGEAEGASADLPPLPKWSESWRLGPPNLVVKLPQPYAL
ncbi:MAG: hypothetical protein QOJ40_453, partial [Verrucomicrobiota bacterium]